MKVTRWTILYEKGPAGVKSGLGAMKMGMTAFHFLTRKMAQNFVDSQEKEWGRYGLQKLGWKVRKIQYEI